MSNIADILPWEDRKDDSCVLWRYSKNPVIPRNILPFSNSVFNSAVIPYQDGFRGVFRCDNTAREMCLHSGKSKDGLKWEINFKPIDFIGAPKELGAAKFGYDPRICKIEDRFYVTWCNDCHGPTIGIAWTEDFEQFHQLENAFLPYNRNGVLFPKKINGNYAMLSRPSDNGHTEFGDIFYSESPDLCFWGKHRFVMGRTGAWQSLKIGAGPTPIETSDGWLAFYHGVLRSCNGYVYSFGAALLDLEQPWKVIYRTKPYLFAPQAIYECVGDVPNVVFPCATLLDRSTGRIAIYYGAADTVTCLAFGYLDEIIDFVKNNTMDSN